MKKIVLLLAMAFAATSFAATAPVVAQSPELKPLPQQTQAATLAARILTHNHYKSLPLDDAMSQKIFDQYLKALDPEKLFFIKADIDRFAKARTLMDDAINNQQLGIPFAMYNLYERRVMEHMTYARELLKKEFDFTQHENYYTDREKEPWAVSESALRNLWRQRVKNDWLRLKLAGKDSAAIRKTLEKRYDYSLKRIQKSKSDDVFQLFMNAYATAIEPHTNYLGPRATEDFDIAMKLSLSGIGAVLMEKDEFTTIRELTPGGPAMLSGKLTVGDRIVGVGQGADSVPTDVLGWRLDDVVALIRGTKDTVVALEILPADAGPDGKHRTITLVRNKITLEQQAAKKSVIDIKLGDATRHIGIVSLPTFYQDFQGRQNGDKEFKSATRDVAKILAELKKDKVDGVLVDLRNNGGGSLDEAIELSGLFIGSGPVVQQRDSEGRIQISNDKDASVAWDGPLGVLINRGSASASEIFAAAMQDYGRGLIIGEGSFGKGTVQTMVSLDRYARNEQANLGELKMTIAQFFRINGGTTQLRGVEPDISFPSFADPDAFGESSYDNALPWVQIKAADYRPVGDIKGLLPALKMRHDARSAKDREYQFLLEDVKEFNTERLKKFISLNEIERSKQRDAREAKTKLREKLRLKEKKADGDKSAGASVKPSTQDDGLQANERSLSEELAAEKARKEAKDPLLDEAAYIVGDEVDLAKASEKLAARQPVK